MGLRLSLPNTQYTYMHMYATILSINQLCIDGDLIYESALEVLVLIALSSNEGSGESVHMHRLARSIAARIHKLWM